MISRDDEKMEAGGNYSSANPPNSPDDLWRQPNMPRPRMLHTPPASTIADDDDYMSIQADNHRRQGAANSAGLQGIPKGAATSAYDFGAGFGEGFGTGFGTGVGAGVGAGNGGRERPTLNTKRSRLFGRLRRDRREPSLLPSPPTALPTAFSQLSIVEEAAGQSGSRGQGRGQRQTPLPPGQTAATRAAAAAAASPARSRPPSVTYAEIDETLDLLRQLNIMELEIQDSRFVITEDNLANLNKQRRARERTDMLCHINVQRMKYWWALGKESWTAAEWEDIEFGMKHADGLWRVGAESRRRLAEERQ